MSSFKDSEHYPLPHHHNSVPAAHATKLYEQPFLGAKPNNHQKNPNGSFE